MFKNMGKKIKTVGIILCWLGIVFNALIGVVLVIVAILMSASADAAYYVYSPAMVAIMGIIVAALGALSSWIGSFFICGFGELIENSAKINNSLNEIKGKIANEESLKPTVADL